MGKVNYRKFKKSSNTTFIVISFAIVTLSLSLGYSLFFESLNINGSASLAEVITDKLEFQLISTGGRYVTGSFPANAAFSSETYDNANNLTLNLSMTNTTGRKEDSIYYIDFINPYGDNLTLGSIQSNGISGDIATVNSSLTKTALTPSESGRLTVNLNHSNKSGTVQVNTIVQYTYKGIVKYFYFTILIV